ncbi:MAG: gliding motility-associated C-terminal domain-containing protein [Flavobacteriales bacterium]|nr:gliding motility-associated C-terminal domain-containing protein [Flavobacteriales bacterium]
MSFVLLAGGSYVYGQFPATCFEIESILVDACGSPEGENEMVRFVTGPSALDVNNMTAIWPNNGWLGICQNAGTANSVSNLNATIQSCGFLLEPPGGIIPANSKVLLITSENINTTANSFANLSDTLYVIFQCAGNTNGHFANWTSTLGLRTLIISFTNPAGCSDTVTYDRSVLLNQNGTIGGTAAIRDGALANFDWNNTVSYDNLGCQAPFVPATISTNGISSLSICPGDSFQLYAQYSSPIPGITWNGQTGTFSSSNNDTTFYFPGVNDTGSFYLTATGISNCGDTIIDSLLVTINSTSVSSQNVSICQGQVFSLPGGGTTALAGIYTDTIPNANGCDSIITSTLIVNAINSSIQNATICQGQTFTLPGGNGATISGQYTDTLTNASATGCDSIVTTNLTVNPLSTSSINDTICQGQSYQLPGGTSVTSAGAYTDTLTNASANGCDSIITVNLTVNGASVNLIENDTTICSDEFLTLHALGSNLSWSNGVTGVDSIVVTTSGIYTVSSTTNNCSASDQMMLIVEDCLVQEFLIPNVFTPNHDDNNDRFTVTGSGIMDLNGSIYNRWGEKIYDWVGPGGSWDGHTHAGAEVPAGTYYYIIQITWNNNETEIFNGYVSLMR